MLILKNKFKLFFISLLLFLTLLITVDRRPLLAAFVWDRNRKDVERLNAEVEELKSIIQQLQGEISADAIKKSVQEGTRLLIERMERFKQEMEMFQEGLRDDKKNLDEKIEALREEFMVIAGLKEELRAWKADVKADIDESIQGIRMETEDRIGRIEVSNSSIVGNLQKSLDTLSEQNEDRDRDNADLKNTLREDITSIELLLSENLEKMDKEIDSIKYTLRMRSEDRDRDLSLLESNLTKNLVERDKEVISLISNIQQELEGKEKGLNALKEAVDNIHERLNLLNQRLSFLEKTSVKPSSAREKPTQPAIKDKITKGPIKQDKDARKDPAELEMNYSEAQKAIRDKDYKSALQLLRDFLSKYPDTELSDNAQYWIGEVYYDQKDFTNAILAFDKVVNRYPIGDKVPDALLKEGLSFYNLGKLEMAKIFLERVRKEYPETKLAAIANKNLKKIAERTESQ